MKNDMTSSMPLSESTPLGAIVRLSITENEAEVARQMQICNACRYCEGYCAVFPAMTRRLEFAKADVNYLANLCHNCGACYHACQYAPPHEFAVNVPQAMARVRLETYSEYAWPATLGKLYRRNGIVVSAVLIACITAFLLLTMLANGGAIIRPGLKANFYSVFPHNTLALTFGVSFVYSIVAMLVGISRFWRSIGAEKPDSPSVLEATGNALTLKYLDGGHGAGCNETDDRFTLIRRRFHHLTFYGFLLCFAATIVATIYHYFFDWHAPYAVTSAPVVLGVLGGIGLIVGPLGLLWLNLKRDPARGDAAQRGMDRAFMVLLVVVSFTGLALLAVRETSFMPLLLALHLGSVMALFLTLPYGKFAHGFFRSAALLKCSIEKRQALKFKLGGD